MKIYLKGIDNRYEIEKLVRIFLPFEKVEFCDNIAPDTDCVLTVTEGEKVQFNASLSMFGKTKESKKEYGKASAKLTERRAAAVLYDCFCSITGYSSRWGILTGIRPAKLYSNILKGSDEAAADNYFLNELRVSKPKLDLLKQTRIGEEEIINKSGDKSFSLYVGIPFCPSRCSYCSFVSHSVESAKVLIPTYVDMLVREIEYTGKIAKDLGLKLETVYIGGGTPTTLSAEQLGAVMTAISNNFDLSTISEYTVEAGRPDTVTRDKLISIKAGGATRISINPQTSNDEVLKAISRPHTFLDIKNAFYMARELGFNNINMDLIAGLPQDNYESFCHSVDDIIALCPESVTVHTLCMKRSSTLTKEADFERLKYGEETSQMLDYSKRQLEKHEYLPYYMYRQSKMVGNLENVGYSKAGYEGLYNVYIMDETHTILSCGASAVTKLRRNNPTYIERIFNFKYPYEYINNFEEQLKRKEKIFEFYK